MTGLPALIPATLALALYAGLAFHEAARLFAVDARTLVQAGVILALFAVGLIAKQLWAYLFALLFLGVSALGYGVAAASLGYDAAFGTGGGSGFEGVKTFIVLLAAAALGLASLLSSGLALPLLLSWRAVTTGHSWKSWVVAMGVAGAALGSVAWSVGHDYAYRWLPLRHECLSGRGSACYNLASDKRLPTAERREFARRGCEAWNDGACRILGEFDLAAPGARSPEVIALARRCLLGKPDLCLAIGRQLLKVGDPLQGARYLERACEVEAGRCVTAAGIARKGGQEGLSRSLLERGCEVDNPRSCTALLNEAGSQLDPEHRRRLEMKACLLGDVNDCRSLMRADLRPVCEVICEGVTENRFHTCFYCAEEARKIGEQGRAERWLASTCEKGYRWSCRELTRLQERPESEGP